MLIRNLFANIFETSSFFRVVIPHLEERYFYDNKQKIIFRKINDYHNKYARQPNYSDIKLLIESDTDITESETESCVEYLAEIKTCERVADEKLLIEQVEEFCQQRALELAILDSVEILQNKDKAKGGIEDKIKKALAVEFDVKIGMDYFKDAVSRYEKYVEEEEVLPTDNELINAALNGGYRRKSLILWMGRTNIGKTLILCHHAACFLKQGKNVLYISGEMSEDMITKRIDANLLDINMNEINKNLDKKMFLSRVKDLCLKTQGKLIVKEYPAGTANANHIKNLINEVKLKRGFVPDVVILDYLNLFGSSRLKSEASANSYHYIKSVAEELRGVAVTFNLAMISATQTNRTGSQQTSDLNMETATSESYGLPMTVDAMIGIVQTPELFEQNKYVIKLLKSRFNDNINAVYTIGVDRPHMRLINLNESQQEIPLHIKDSLKRQQREEEEREISEGFDFS